MKKQIIVLRAYLLLAWVEGIGAFLLTSNSGKGLLTGISTARATILGGILAGIGVFSYLSFHSWRGEVWSEKTLKRMEALSEKAWFFLLGVSLSLAGLILAAENLLLTEGEPSGISLRLAPALIWFAALGAQTIICMALLGYHRPYVERLAVDRKTLAWAVTIVIIVLLAWAWMRATGYGLRPQRTTWGEPHAPLLLWQVVTGLGFAALLLGSRKAFEFISGRFPWFAGLKKRVGRTDLAIALGLWALTAVVWLSVPVEPSGYTVEPKGSESAFYPYLDATIYDSTAQNMLIGKGLVGSEADIPARPMFSFFLFLAHSLVGQDYERVITIQVILLAVFPGLVYLLATALNGRAAGAFVAFLVMLRELNAYDMGPFAGGISHTKAMMSDYPAGVGMALLLLITVVWIRRPRQRILFLLIVGCVIGFLALIRSQVIIFGPLMLLVIFIVYFRERKAWLSGSLLLIAGIVIFLLPWAWRNKQVAGRFTVLGRGELGLVEWSLGSGGGNETEGLLDALGSVITSGSGFLTEQFLPHYIHNTVVTFFILPATFKIDQIKPYVLEMPMWHPPWLGYLPPETLLPILTNLALVAIGLAWAWRKQKLVGILPLLFYLTYGATTAAVRLSGRRYILPVDWIILVYYGIGIVQSSGWLLHTFSNWEWADRFLALQRTDTALPPEARAAGGFSWWLGGLISAAMLVVAVAPWVTESAMRPRLEAYAAIRTEEVLTALETSFPELIEQVEAFSTEENARVIHGRALYPQVFEADVFHFRPGRLYSRIWPRSYDRAGFLLIGPEEEMVLYRADEIFAIPQAADVLVIGCQEGNLVSALAVFVLGESPNVVFPEPTQSFICEGSNGG